MAFINKLFTGRSRKSLHNSNASHSKSFDFPFNSDQVRVLLFEQCEFRGRKLLFDSSAVQRVVTTTTVDATTASSNDNKPPAPSNVHHQSRSSRVTPNPSPVAPKSMSSPAKKKMPPFVESIDGVTYVYDSPGSDCNELAELIWGSVAMNYQGSSLKVHWVKTPPRIMCSQVFLPPTQLMQSHSSKPYTGDGTASDISSLDTTSLSSFNGDGPTSYPMDVPSSGSVCDSGYQTDYHPWFSSSVSSLAYPATTRSSFGSAYSEQERKCSIDSSIQGASELSSWAGGRLSSEVNPIQRRVLRNLSTSFETNTMSDIIGPIGETTHYPQAPPVATGTPTNGGSDGCVGAKWRRNSEVIPNDRLSNPEMARRKASGETITIPFHSHVRLTGSARRTKLAIAVCITLNAGMESDMKTFYSEHMALFESMLNRLRAMVEKAYVTNQNFRHQLLRAWRTTLQWITDIFTAPRMTDPIWLTLSSTNAPPLSLAKTFITELCSLLSHADTKDTKFFMSTLLTAILTYHLGWVGCVTSLQSTATDNEYSAAEGHQQKISEISKNHPYNALWAQLSDLYGAIGYPPKISRTIVTGKCHSTMDKVLNVLTYFIRCGEIKRNSHTCNIHKRVIDNIMENMDEHMVKVEPYQLRPEGEEQWRHNDAIMVLGRVSLKEPKSRTGAVGNGGCNGLTRTMTHIKSLNQLEVVDNGVALPIEALTINKTPDMVKILKKNVMNDIPKVFVYRDSRAVQQELRIGNHLMDTGIEMTSKIRREMFPYQVKSPSIKLMITSPENVQINVEEALEEGSSSHRRKVSLPVGCGLKSNRSLSDLITANSLGSGEQKTKLLWGIEPIKEGININQIRHFERGVEISEESHFSEEEDCDDDEAEAATSNFSRSGSIYTKSGNRKNSDHITRSKCSRWKYNPNGYMVRPQLKQEKGAGPKDGNVVFVLGDDERLVNLKHQQQQELLSSVGADERSGGSEPCTSGNTNELGTAKKMCNHKTKKHSGVKFNFEQYPQIVQNYMRNKNYHMTANEFLEKALKMERENEGTSASEQRVPLNLSTLTNLESDEEEECGCCAGNKMLFLQTPSNASELEYSNEDNNSYGQLPLANERTTGETSPQKKCDSEKEDAMKIVSFPMPELENVTKSMSDVHDPGLVGLGENEPNPLQMTMRCGMVPSLMIGVTDHYIPDMVLQGVTLHEAQLHWEMHLKRDLTLSARCATIEQTPTENVAIVANVDNWEVRILSSNTYHIPVLNADAEKGSLVSYAPSVVAMLETVHAMWTANLPVYQCMSYIESKLQEFYLQSETLAAFLLATDFCTIDDVADALNLSANDIPLLLSVASTHTPQVTRKYGVSCR